MVDGLGGRWGFWTRVLGGIGVRVGGCMSDWPEEGRSSIQLVLRINVQNCGVLVADFTANASVHSVGY